MLRLRDPRIERRSQMAATSLAPWQFKTAQDNGFKGSGPAISLEPNPARSRKTSSRRHFLIAGKSSVFLEILFASSTTASVEDSRNQMRRFARRHARGRMEQRTAPR